MLLNAMRSLAHTKLARRLGVWQLPDHSTARGFTQQLADSDFDQAGWRWERPDVVRKAGMVPKGKRVEHVLWGREPGSEIAAALEHDRAESTIEESDWDWVPDSIYRRFLRLAEQHPDVQIVTLLDQAIDEVEQFLRGRNDEWLELWLRGVTCEREIMLDAAGVRLEPGHVYADQGIGGEDDHPDLILRVQLSDAINCDTGLRILRDATQLLRLLVLAPITVLRDNRWLDDGREPTRCIADPYPGTPERAGSWLPRARFLDSQSSDLDRLLSRGVSGTHGFTGSFECLDEALFAPTAAHTSAWCMVGLESILKVERSEPSDATARRASRLVERHPVRQDAARSRLQRIYGGRHRVFHGEPTDNVREHLEKIRADVGDTEQEFYRALLLLFQTVFLRSLRLCADHGLTQQEIIARLDRNEALPD